MRSIKGLLCAALLLSTACGADAGGDSSGNPAKLCSADTPLGEPCVDDLGALLCSVDSGYPGDELALCDQGEDRGLRLHYGPSDYDDPDDVATYLLGPGEEDENCTYFYTPNTEDRLVKSYRGRMRPNSHHLILTLQTDDETFRESDVPGPCNLIDTVGATWLVGSQDPKIDIAIGGGMAGGFGAESQPDEPDYGLGQTIRARTPIQLDMHYTNPTQETLLREAWVWFDYAEPSEVRTHVDMITFYQGQIEIPPHSTFTTRRAYCTAKSDRYIGLVTGHAHSKMTRFSVWHATSDGTENLVYETYNWAEPGNLFYRNAVQNPVPDPAIQRHGGASGYVLVREGEALSFECEFKNDTSDEITLGETAKDEMCNVFGMYYPTDGDTWNCACLGNACVDKVPDGFQIPGFEGASARE